MIQSFNDAVPKNKVESIQAARLALVDYPKKINHTWLTLECCFNWIIKNHGGNEYKIDHILKERLEETGVQNNDEGPCEQKKPHSASYTAMEDVMVTMAYFKASEDLICGAKQKGHTFRSKIELAYNTIKKQEEETEAQDLLRPSHLRAMDTEAMPYSARTGLLLYQHFQKTISPPIIKFISIEKSNPSASGEELIVWKRHLHDIYKAKYSSEFKCYSCYEFAKDHPKFLSLFSMETTTNQSVVDEDGDVVNKKCKEGVGSATKCLVGTKRVKQMKKEDKMVNRLSQKFGITLNKTKNDKETSQLKTTTKNLPSLHEALVGFLSITGQGISAWMMQSMSNSTSNDIKKEYANEMMKQQILKIHHNNAKMMKELTEMKSLSSLSSAPPVNDILCKSTNVEILSAPSLPTPDNENEEDKEEENEGEEDIYT